MTAQLSELNSRLKIFASSDHSDDTIVYRDEKESNATANGQLIPIVGQGSILNMTADYVLSFVDSLISLSQITKSLNSCVMFLEKAAFNICLTSPIIPLLSQIKTIAEENNLLLCTATLTADNLYAVDKHNTYNTYFLYLQVLPIIKPADWTLSLKWLDIFMNHGLIAQWTYSNYSYP